MGRPTSDFGRPRARDSKLPSPKRDPRTILEANTIFSIIFRRTPVSIHANAQRSRELHAEGILKVERIPRAPKNGNVIAAEHKVLGEENESRPHHRYAVVVHDVATQWIQSYPRRKKECARYDESVAAILSSRMEAWSDSH